MEIGDEIPQNWNNLAKEQMRNPNWPKLNQKFVQLITKKLVIENEHHFGGKLDLKIDRNSQKFG